MSLYPLKSLSLSTCFLCFTLSCWYWGLRITETNKDTFLVKWNILSEIKQLLPVNEMNNSPPGKRVSSNCFEILHLFKPCHLILKVIWIRINLKNGLNGMYVLPLGIPGEQCVHYFWFFFIFFVTLFSPRKNCPRV